MNIEERLREKSKVVLPFEQSCNTLNYTPIRFIDLDDALEITKDLFTKEQVEELLKKQREICSDIACVILPSHPHLHCTKNVNTASIYTASSPSLEGEKK